MMKKLLFCLLTLVGTGMFYSCQQDGFVNESTVSKGATITATLPTDAQSRLALGDPENGTVKLKWEIGDIVIGLGSLQFKVVRVSEDGSTATLYCEDAPEYLPSNSVAYEFVYGVVPDYDEQSGTLDGLCMTATVGADQNVPWENVILRFEVYSAIVEIELPDDVSATKVSLYDSSNGALIASTVENSYSDKVYLAVIANQNVNIGGGLVLVETSNGYHVAQVGQNSLESGKVYSINKSKMVASQNSGTVNYVYVDEICFIYGSGAISDGLFNNTGIQHAIILEGVTSIGEEAFYGFSVLKSIDIASSVTTINKKAFFGCSSLETVTFGDNSELTSIGEEAFCGCSSLYNIEIPASVNSIGKNAFFDCSSLEIVTCLAVDPPTLGNIVFDNCHGSLIIYVPSGKVDTYKGTSGWSSYAGKIQAKP